MIAVLLRYQSEGLAAVGLVVGVLPLAVEGERAFMALPLLSVLLLLLLPLPSWWFLLHVLLLLLSYRSRFSLSLFPPPSSASCSCGVVSVGCCHDDDRPQCTSGGVEENTHYKQSPTDPPTVLENSQAMFRLAWSGLVGVGVCSVGVKCIRFDSAQFDSILSD